MRKITPTQYVKLFVEALGSVLGEVLYDIWVYFIIPLIIVGFLFFIVAIL